MSKRFWILLGVLLVVFIGIIWIGAGKNAAGTSTAATDVAPVHITGNQNAKVKLVEYGDFQCPYCGVYYPVVEQVVQKYQGQISFEFRQYPLTSIHPNAFAAARAAEAAGQQGKFWEMYRLLYANQSQWADSSNASAVFNNYAQQLGLNMQVFKNDFASSKTNAAINASVAGFNKLGLAQATPTFLLNDKQVQPGTSIAGFSKLIDTEL